MLNFGTLTEIVEQLESCGFVCEAGPLEMNVAWQRLKEMVKPEPKYLVWTDTKLPRREQAALRNELDEMFAGKRPYTLLNGVVPFDVGVDVAVEGGDETAVDSSTYIIGITEPLIESIAIGIGTPEKPKHINHPLCGCDQCQYQRTKDDDLEAEALSVCRCGYCQYLRGEMK